MAGEPVRLLADGPVHAVGPDVGTGALLAAAAAHPGDVVHQVAGAIRNYAMPDLVLDDYLASYAGTRYIESVPYVRSYPTDLAVLAPLLPELHTPVQIIVGRDDPYGLADDAEVLNRGLPDSRLDVLDTGHCAWEEDPRRYASIAADWINRAG